MYKQFLPQVYTPFYNASKLGSNMRVSYILRLQEKKISLFSPKSLNYTAVLNKL